MAKNTNCTINGNSYCRIKRKVGMKLDKHGIWVDDYKVFYGKTKKEAEQKYEDFKKQGQSLALNKQCLGEALDQWVKTVFLQSTLAEGTKLNYLSAYKRVFREQGIAGKSLAEITPLDLQNFYNENLMQVAYSTLKSLHKFLKLFFKYADINDLCRDITYSLTLPKKKKIESADFDNDVGVWDDEHIKKVIENLKGTTKRLLIVLAVNTGARISELLALTYDDIKGNLLYINKQLSERNIDGTPGFHLENTKSISSTRVIPLPDRILDEIEMHKALHKSEMLENNYQTNNIFTTASGNYYYRRNIQKSLERLYKRIDVPYHKFHDFRHTFGTNLSRAGVPIEETSKLMGHASVEVTAKYYINVNAQRRLNAVEKIVDFSLSE